VNVNIYHDCITTSLSESIWRESSRARKKNSEMEETSENLYFLFETNFH